MELYEELNQLIIKERTCETRPVRPTPRSILPAPSRLSGKSVVTKWQSFYPGIAVMVTVEGAVPEPAALHSATSNAANSL